MAAVTITFDDLTPAARERLDAAGVEAFSLSVTPKAAPSPTPAPDGSAAFVGLDTTKRTTENVISPQSVFGATYHTWPGGPSCFYSPTTFLIHLPKGRVSLYFIDWDKNGRSQKVELLDAASGAMLDSRTVSNFQGGIYATWDVTGAVRVRITNTAGSGTNAVLSGVFLGGAMPAPAPAQMRASVVYDPLAAADLPGVVYAADTREYLDARCESWAVLPAGTNPPPSLPWVTLAHPTNGHYSGPLPATDAEVLALLRKYGG